MIFDSIQALYKNEDERNNIRRTDSVDIIIYTRRIS